MVGRDEPTSRVHKLSPEQSGTPASATRVAVLEPRRLFRQALSIWLTEQDGIAFMGSATSTSTVAQLCRGDQLDVAVVGSPDTNDQLLHEVALLAQRHEQLRLVATTDSTDDEVYSGLLAQGFHAVVPTSAGASPVLSAIRIGAVAKSTVRTHPTIDLTSQGSPLTPREAEVLSLVGRGSTTYDISAQLGISRSTVANHKERIFNKLEAKNQAHAVARAVNLGLIAPTRQEDPRQVG